MKVINATDGKFKASIEFTSNQKYENDSVFYIEFRGKRQYFQLTSRIINSDKDFYYVAIEYQYRKIRHDGSFDERDLLDVEVFHVTDKELLDELQKESLWC